MTKDFNYKLKFKKIRYFVRFKIASTLHQFKAKPYLVSDFERSIGLYDAFVYHSKNCNSSMTARCKNV